MFNIESVYVPVRKNNNKLGLTINIHILDRLVLKIVLSLVLVL
jgi:hypothetical protein